MIWWPCYTGQVLVRWRLRSCMCCRLVWSLCFFFFFQAEDGIRDVAVTGVQTCALPISVPRLDFAACDGPQAVALQILPGGGIGRGAGRGRGEISGGAVSLKKKKKKIVEKWSI